jgi:hypothetical protein
MDQHIPPQAQTLIDAVRAWRAARASELWVKISEATEPLGLRETKIRALMRDGRLLHRRSGGTSLLSIDSIVEFVIEEILATYRPGARSSDARAAALVRAREAKAQARAVTAFSAPAPSAVPAAPPGEAPLSGARPAQSRGVRRS